jgi:hypothetical protein
MASSGSRHWTIIGLYRDWTMLAIGRFFLGTRSPPMAGPRCSHNVTWTPLLSRLTRPTKWGRGATLTVALSLFWWEIPGHNKGSAKPEPARHSQHDSQEAQGLVPLHTPLRAFPQAWVRGMDSRRLLPALQGRAPSSIHARRRRSCEQAGCAQRAPRGIHLSTDGVPPPEGVNTWHWSSRTHPA